MILLSLSLKPELLKLEYLHESPGDLVKNAGSHPAGLARSPRFCFSNKLPGDTGAAVPGPHSEYRGLYKWLLLCFLPFICVPGAGADPEWRRGAQVLVHHLYAQPAGALIPEQVCLPPVTSAPPPPGQEESRWRRLRTKLPRGTSADSRCPVGQLKVETELLKCHKCD